MEGHTLRMKKMALDAIAQVAFGIRMATATNLDGRHQQIGGLLTFQGAYMTKFTTQGIMFFMIKLCRA